MSELQVIRTVAELRASLDPARRAGPPIGLVPTMGALHDGHLSLLEAARKRADIVVMSLFVNPTQFGEGEDLEAYPRDEERDLELAAEAGATIVFAPAADEVYPDGFSTHVEVEGLTDVLCGDPSRRGAGHFRGVTTVVAKLLNMATPDFVFFGQKDAQQAIVIGRMVRDLDFAAAVVVVPTVREPDGLAMSSRNAYLDPAERERATALNRALAAAAASHAHGVDTALGAARDVLSQAEIEPEYLEARYADDLEPAQSFNGRPVLVAVAARLGKARLIDNVVINPDQDTADTSHLRDKVAHPVTAAREREQE
jgi:pantoate--beta-alanine ligase